MIATKYNEVLELLKSKSLKQSEIADKLNISLDMVKKLSQLNKIYSITDDEDLLLKIKELNFKAIELKYLKYADELGSVLDKLDKDSSRDEIKKVCIDANNSKDKHLRKVKELKDNSDRAIESEISRKKTYEMNISSIENRNKQIEIAFNNIEYVLKDLDPVLAALVYNRYITVKNVQRLYGEWGIYPVVKNDVKISKEDWDYMQRSNIVERIWKQGYQWPYAINIILDVKGFAEYIGKNKRKNNVTELELYKDRDKLLKEKNNEIKMYKRNIFECNGKIESIKNSDIFNVDLEKETGDILPTYKNQINKYDRIKFEEGSIYIKNVVIDGIKLDTVTLDKDNDITILMKDTIKANGDIYKEIAKRYTNENYQKLRRIAKYVVIDLEIIYDYETFYHTQHKRVPVHNLKNWCNRFIDLEIENILFNDYEDEVEAKGEDELMYLIALDMSKKFLY